MSENELENGITAVDAGGAVALDDGCCPERGAAAPGHPKKATGGVRQAVILSEATVGSEVEGSRAAPAESVREYEPLAVEGRLGYHFVKRAFDIVFSACATIVGLIPVALLCLVIRLESPGSPIYLQERVGYRGQPLRIFKLRTMVADSDDVEKHLSPEQLAQWRSERKVEDDPRVTRVGRFLRRTSLASVIIGTPGAGEPTNSLSSAAKTSFDQQFYDRRPEVSPATQSIIPAPNSCLFTFFGGSRKAQYELEARADGADQGGSPWRGKASSSMIEKGAYCLTPALGVAA